MDFVKIDSDPVSGVGLAEVKGGFVGVGGAFAAKASSMLISCHGFDG
jgi:hypothetical protein